MKVLVAIKSVADYNIKVRVNSDFSGVDLNGVRMSMNPFDEVAVEAAVRLYEAKKIEEITVVSLGFSHAKETLRTALAMGAHRGIFIKAESPMEPLVVASVLHRLVLDEKPSLVLTGKQAIDDDCAQTGPMLAGLLGWGQGCCVSSLDIEDGRAKLVREIDDGEQILELMLPALVSVDLNLAEPRYLALPDILSARKKTIEERSICDFEVDCVPRLQALQTYEVSSTRAGIYLENVVDFVERLKQDISLI